jgi:hypothetical protein
VRGVCDDVLFVDRAQAIIVSPFRSQVLIAGFGRVADEHAPAPLLAAADLLDEQGSIPVAVIVSVEQLGSGQWVAFRRSARPERPGYRRALGAQWSGQRRSAPIGARCRDAGIAGEAVS